MSCEAEYHLFGNTLYYLVQVMLIKKYLSVCATTNLLKHLKTLYKLHETISRNREGSHFAMSFSPVPLKICLLNKRNVMQCKWRVFV